MNLPEGGQLYLDNYYVLNEARQQMEIYLEAVMEQTYSFIREALECKGIESLPFFSWKTYKTKLGYQSIYTDGDANEWPFLKNKQGAIFRMSDVRSSSKLGDDVRRVSILVDLTKSMAHQINMVGLNDLEAAMQLALERGAAIHLDFSNPSELFKEYVSFGQEPIQTAQEIANVIASACNSFVQFIVCLREIQSVAETS